MLKGRNNGNREEVPLDRVVLSNMYSIEAVTPKAEETLI